MALFFSNLIGRIANTASASTAPADPKVSARPAMTLC